MFSFQSYSLSFVMFFDHSYPFLQNTSAVYSFYPRKYFSEQILLALARNPLDMLVIVLEDIQECGFTSIFVRAGLR